MKTLLIIYFALAATLSFANPIDYGLRIQAYPSESTDFSTLVLENNEPLDLGKELTLSFNMNIRNENIFGVVFRIITNKNENIDLIFSAGENNKRFPMLVVNESIHPLKQEAICDTWLPVHITLSPENEKITLVYGTEEITAPYPFLLSSSARIAFGNSPFDNFSVADIASVNLKDIRIFQNNELTRYWQLSRHAHMCCYDSIRQSPALITNPHWLIDNHATWESLFTGNIPDNTLFAFNPVKSEFYFVSDSKEVLVFNGIQKTLSTLPVQSGKIAANAPNQLLYDSQRDQLISYNMDENLYAAFSFESNEWNNSTAPIQEHGYWNNTACYLPEDSSIISFGGYGFYKYTNELIRITPFRTPWKKTDTLSVIEPRYASASVIVDNVLYIFGGRGCKSGRQELFPKHYYDLHSVNLETLQVDKIWEAPQPEADFLPGENMFYNKDDNCFYLISTKDKGTLLKIDTQKKDFEQMSFPIGEDMETHYIYTNLYYSAASNKLFALINKTKVDRTSKLSIYSITFPPVPITSLHQEITGYKQAKSIGWLTLFSVLAGISLWSLLYVIKKRQRMRPVTTPLQTASTAKDTPTLQNNTPTTLYYDFSKQSISLLGTFCIRDKEGEEITDQFTPMLKQLLILLILFTVKNKSGIPGKELIQYLWPDKTEESAKNNRNVYLSKLRVLLEKVGDIEIINKNSAWTIRFGAQVTCDYVEAMYHFAEIINPQAQSLAYLSKLLELLLRGSLLPDLETDWADNFKSNFSSRTIDVLTLLLKEEQRNFDNNFKLRIADTIFLHDYINEDALYTKCSILCDSGKRGLAKNIYDNFCKEYLNLLDTPYKRSLSDVINKNANEQK